MNKETPIPNIIHFVFINESFNEPFQFFHYLAIYSAYLVNKPDKIFFYHKALPFGENWEKVLEIPTLILEEVDIPTKLKEKPLLNYAHKADVVRLEKLYERGGVYMDMDTVCVKPYKHLLFNQMVMGKQQNYAGLCNAIMMAAPGCEFIKIWQEKYEEHFKPRGWNESSIRLPYTLANKYPHLITVLPPECFFLPNWNETDKIFLPQNPPVSINDKLITLHLWQSSSKKFLGGLVDYISCLQSTLYGQIIKKLIKNYGLMYVRSPKTASSSVVEMFKRNFKKVIEIHDSTSIIKLSQDIANNLVEDDCVVCVASVFYMKHKQELNNLFGKKITFGITRDPYTKAVSAWKYCKAIKNKPLLDVLHNPPQPRRHNNHDWIHFSRTQSEGLFYDLNTSTPQLNVDLLFKFEYLEKLTVFLSLVFGRSFDLKHLNITRNKPEYKISPEEVKMINENYKLDFKLLNYNLCGEGKVSVKPLRVISFCLYGEKLTYLVGMEENIKLAKQHFPDWTVYIYYNKTVPLDKIKLYKEMGAKTFLCENVGTNLSNWEGMFWRFFPLDDPTVDAWLSRDADSRLSAREAGFVNQWLESGKSFHIIRDHRCHMHFIMGGIFGVNNREFLPKYRDKIKPIKEIIQENYKYYKERCYNVDQLFLNNFMWNLIENDHMAHRCPEGRKVKNTDIEVAKVEHFVGKQYRIKEPEKALEEKDLPPVINGNDVYDKPVKIISEKSGLCLDVNEKGDFLTNKESSIGQTWIFGRDGTLCLKHLQKYVVVEHCEKMRGTLKLVDNKEIVDITSGIKLWTITNEGFIYNKHSNLVFDIKGGMTNVGTPVRLHKLNRSLAQKWRFKIVDEENTVLVEENTDLVEENTVLVEENDIVVDNSSLDLTQYKRNIHNQFDKIYIVHLKRLVDRKKLIDHQLTKFNIDMSKVVIIDAVDKLLLNPAELKKEEKWAYPGNTFWCNNVIINDRGDKCWCEGKGHPLNRGQFACQLSHIKVYEHIVKNKVGRALVLEDDFFFSDNIHEQINEYFKYVPQNWELLYLCQSHYKSQNRHNTHINNPYFIKRKRGCAYTTMYAIKLSAATDLFNDAFPMRAAADGYLSSLVDRSYKIKNAYITKEDFCKNASKIKDNAIKTTL